MPRKDEKVTSELGRAGGETWGKADTFRATFTGSDT